MTDLSLHQTSGTLASRALALIATLSCFCFFSGCDSPKPGANGAVSGSSGPAATGPEANVGPQIYPSAVDFQAFEQNAPRFIDDPSPQEEAEPEVSEQPSVAIKYASWEEILASVKSSGKPSIVDVWSLACEPCMKEFPGLVKLQQEYGDRLRCVSANVNFDGRRSHPPESYASEVIRFLTFHDAELTNYICSTASDEVFEALEIPSIPAVLLFDGAGNEVARFVDAGETRGFTYEKNINAAVAELLGQSTQQDQPSEQVEQTEPLEQPQNESSTDTTSDNFESPSTPTNQ